MSDTQDSQPQDKNEDAKVDVSQGDEAQGTDSTATESDTQDSRRGFLKKATLGLAGTIGAATALPLIAPILTPLSKDIVSLEGLKIDAGPLTAFNETPRKVSVAVTRTDGWTQTKNEVVGAIYARRDGDTITAFSSICPHASCAVSYSQTSSEYVCPCHNTYFKITGEVARGPSPRGLDTLPATVENGRVIITYKSFRPGTATKEEV